MICSLVYLYLQLCFTNLNSLFDILSKYYENEKHCKLFNFYFCNVQYIQSRSAFLNKVSYFNTYMELILIIRYYIDYWVLFWVLNLQWSFVKQDVAKRIKISFCTQCVCKWFLHSLKAKERPALKRDYIWDYWHYNSIRFLICWHPCEVYQFWALPWLDLIYPGKVFYTWKEPIY